MFYIVELNGIPQMCALGYIKYNHYEYNGKKWALYSVPKEDQTRIEKRLNMTGIFFGIYYPENEIEE